MEGEGRETGKSARSGRGWRGGEDIAVFVEEDGRAGVGSDGECNIGGVIGGNAVALGVEDFDLERTNRLPDNRVRGLVDESQLGGCAGKHRHGAACVGGERVGCGLIRGGDGVGAGGSELNLDGGGTGGEQPRGRQLGVVVAGGECHGGGGGCHEVPVGVDSAEGNGFGGAGFEVFGGTGFSGCRARGGDLTWHQYL